MGDNDLCLGALTRDAAEAARQWRLLTPEAFRTRTPLTPEEQQRFYERVTARDSTDRYWVVTEASHLIAVVGLTSLNWECGHAEIGLVVNPVFRGQGRGAAIVDRVLREAFDTMRLLTVYGETYECARALSFWRRLAEQYGAETAQLPRRTWWAGQLWDAFYFSFAVETWRARRT